MCFGANRLLLNTLNQSDRVFNGENYKILVSIDLERKDGIVDQSRDIENRSKSYGRKC